MPGWRTRRWPAACSHALAGANHVRQAHRNRLENVAKHLFAAAVLLGSCAAILSQGKDVDAR